MTGRELAQASLVGGVSGNISVRQENEIIITSHGSSFAHLTGHDLARINFEGNQISAAVPSMEKALHIKIYKERKDVNAIIHTHSVFASVLSYLNEPLMDVNPEAKEFLNVKVSDLRPSGSPELAEEATKKLGKEPAVLLERQGVVVVGTNLVEALPRAFIIEEIAKLTYFIKLMQK